MKHTLLSAAVLAAAAGAAASQVAGTLQFDIGRAKRSTPYEPTVERMRRRNHLRTRAVDGTVSKALDNDYYLYYANVTVGTPGQSLRLQIDTGSSDIWFQSGENEVCQKSSDPCADSGIFEPDDSSTYSVVSSDFSIQYGDYSYAKGVYATETFTIGSASVTNLTVGVATDANATDGIMGIGYAGNEAIVASKGSSYEYNNLPDLLVSQGFIATRAYSLWLNDQEASTGSVLFGGIDRSKFSGELVSLPIDTYYGESSPTEFYVTLDGFGYTSDSKETQVSDSLDTAVLLDSGTSFCYVDSEIVAAIAKLTGAVYSSDVDGYVQTCDVMNVDASIDFYFSNLTIKVPIANIFYPLTDTAGEAITFTSGEAACQLSMMDNSDVGTSILGDTFLRAAYVVYDLDNAVIAMAQTKYNVTDTDIVAITGTIPASASATGSGASAVVSASASETGDSTKTSSVTASIIISGSSSSAANSSATSSSSSSDSTASAGAANTFLSASTGSVATRAILGSLAVVFVTVAGGVLVL
ncbi:aspartic peptidase domain-containing protein [Myxozyma melibiosi]|uniref:Aspartic peptidase domain-containing protein n=1 Tax=Myxozyma melibiosi TaxID=54550 RepID=A0ABR1FEH6_9ASCO